MKYIYLSFLFFSSTIYGQVNEFDGNMMDDHKKITPYHISINLDSFNQISGYSYINNDSMHRNYIEGYFVDSTESVFFKEYSLDNTTYCPIYFHGLIKNLMNNIFVIAGVYKSKDKICSNGHINVINFNFKNSPDAFKNISSKTVSSLNEQELEKAQQLILNESVKKDIEYKIVKGNSTTNIDWKKDSIFIRIFDHEKVDGDRVLIVLNNKIVSDNLLLTNTGTIFKIALNKGVNYLKIKALNVGAFSPNTSKIELYNSDHKEYFLNFLENKQSLEYKINNY